MSCEEKKKEQKKRGRRGDSSGIRPVLGGVEDISRKKGAEETRASWRFIRHETRVGRRGRHLRSCEEKKGAEETRASWRFIRHQTRVGRRGRHLRSSEEIKKEQKKRGRRGDSSGI